MYLLECYIEHPVRSIDQTFTYYSNEPALPGVRVKVDFNHRSIMGFVEQVTETEESVEAVSAEIGYSLKPVEAILDEEPLITEELAELAAWMKETTLSTMISCYQAMLPSKVKPKGSAKRVAEETWAVLSEEEVSLSNPTDE
jgi:primosomal protein N' (replication factor Y)